MSKDKILRTHTKSVVYIESQWAILRVKRSRAQTLLEMLSRDGVNGFVYGSVARGNVHESSDIDIIFTQSVPTFQIEYILQKNNFEHFSREIIMATPWDTVKIYYYLDELESITIPLTKFDKKSLEFYDFGGKIDLTQLKKNKRVGGVDKRLVYIKPTPQGHDELSVINNESIVAKELRISVDIVNQRKNVLLKREEIGRTGVYLKRILEKDESP